MESESKPSHDILISAVGDISLGDHPVCLGHGMRWTFENCGDEVLAQGTAYFKGADVVIGNLETVASDKGLKKNSLRSLEMRGNPESLPILKRAGFNVLGVANNHSLQHGLEAFHHTVNSINSCGMNAIGVDDKDKCLSVPYIFKKNGRQNFVFAISMRPEEWNCNEIPYSYRSSSEKLISEVRELRKACDGFLILSIHWGLEYLDFPSPEQLKLGRSLIDEGVDVIIGHHPHVLQPYEHYKSGLIIYSLGNYIFDLWHPNAKRTAIANIRLKYGCAPEVDFIPVYIDKKFYIKKAGAELSKIINKSLRFDDYRMDRSSNLTQYEYESIYNNKRKGLRKKKYIYFVKNIYRYEMKIIFQSLLRTLYRRITGT